MQSIWGFLFCFTQWARNTWKSGSIYMLPVSWLLKSVAAGSLGGISKHTLAMSRAYPLLLCGQDWEPKSCLGWSFHIQVSFTSAAQGIRAWFGHFLLFLFTIYFPILRLLADCCNGPCQAFTPRYGVSLGSGWHTAGHINEQPVTVTQAWHKQ